MTAADIESQRNAALLRWFSGHGRVLPWRGAADPYAVLVSETMSQQTQAERVSRHYASFMLTFPTVEALAGASLRSLLAAWSGLGYNSRAERLHRAAAIISEEGWPQDVEGLERLPGVGPYTARAVAVFAFGVRVAAPDTNVRRVLSRWHGEPLRGRTLEAVAATDLAEDAAAWNQAVMDLGASVCRPRVPDCAACPVAAWCAGPGVYEPPRHQSRFEGSPRHLRGAIVRTLVRASATIDELFALTEATAGDLCKALEHLEADGVVEETEGAVFRVRQD